MKFKNVNSGEGIEFLNGFEKYYIENNIFDCMVCLEHSNNTVDKKKWFNKDININLNIKEHLNIISTLNI